MQSEEEIKAVDKLLTEAHKLENAEEFDHITSRRVVCGFYKNGAKSPSMCRGCPQMEGTVESCQEEFLELIFDRPQLHWSEDWDKPIIVSREKVKLSEASNVGLACNTCYVSDKCPLMQKNALCGIDWEAEKLGSPKHPKEIMRALIKVQQERVQRSSVVEKLDGGIIDANLSLEIDRLAELAAALSDMEVDKIKISGEISAQTSQPGMLQQLFAGMKKQTEPAQENAAPALPQHTIDVDAIPVQPVNAAEPVKKSTRKNAEKSSKK